MRPISSKTETLHGVRLRIPQLIKEQNNLERGNNNIVIYYILYIFTYGGFQIIRFILGFSIVDHPAMGYPAGTRMAMAFHSLCFRKSSSSSVSSVSWSGFHNMMPATFTSSFCMEIAHDKTNSGLYKTYISSTYSYEPI